jgi:transcriptional regulator with XRE-family HTH domain
MMDMNYTASRIQAGRNELGYTQEDLSSRLGVTAQAVSKWERAVSTPDIDMLLGLSEILGIPVEDLLVDRQRPAWNMAALQCRKKQSAIYEL